MAFQKMEPRTTSGKIYDVQEGLDRAWYAPNGGKMESRNLNADSTHPNPWRPATIWEGNMPGAVTDLNLATWTQPTLQKNEIRFDSNTLGENIRSFGVKGLAIGNFIAVYDLANVKSSKALSIPGKMARWCYVVSPWLAMSTSYAATHHIANKLFPQHENKPGLYASSIITPAMIWGAYKRNWGSGVRFFFCGGILTYAVKYLFDNGLAYYGRNGANESAMSLATDPFGPAAIVSPNDPYHGTARESSKWPNWWQGEDQPAWPVRKYDKELLDKNFDWEPSWKKHLPPEDRNKGPATGS